MRKPRPPRTGKDVVLVKLGMLKDTMSDPSEYLNTRYFYQACYRSHAFDTIIKEVKESDVLPVETIAAFKKRMNDAACTSLNCGHMFSVAADTAEWILDALMS